MEEGWKQIGIVGVDSGQLMISDPAYLDGQWKRDTEYGDKHKKKEFSYAACCDETLKKSFGQLNFKMGHAGVGVVFNSGFGDGVYPVYAYFKNYGTKRNPDFRIREVSILMVTSKEKGIFSTLIGKKIK